MTRYDRMRTMLLGRPSYLDCTITRPWHREKLSHPTQDIVSTYHLVRDPVAKKVLEAKLRAWFPPGGKIDWKHGTFFYAGFFPHPHGTLVAVQ